MEMLASECRLFVHDVMKKGQEAPRGCTIETFGHEEGGIRLLVFPLAFLCCQGKLVTVVPSSSLVSGSRPAFPASTTKLNDIIAFLTYFSGKQPYVY
jgi:hypothetical protein